MWSGLLLNKTFSTPDAYHGLDIIETETHVAKPDLQFDVFGDQGYDDVKRSIPFSDQFFFLQESTRTLLK
jgi:hypothetical protein